MSTDQTRDLIGMGFPLDRHDIALASEGMPRLHDSLLDPASVLTDDPTATTRTTTSGMKPEHFDGLISLFNSRCRTYPNKRLMFYARGKLQLPPKSVSYCDFLDRVEQASLQIAQENVKPGSIVLIHLDSHYDNLLYWWAVIHTGLIPAMSTPLSNNMDQRRAHLLHLQALLDSPLVLTRKGLLPEFSVQDALCIQTIEDLKSAKPCNEFFISARRASSEDPKGIAALMLTSGSTGHSKAVCLSHGLLLRSVFGKAAAFGTNHRTNFLSWIGADHVACLTEIHLHAIWSGGEHVYVEAVDIISNPLAFWEICQKHLINHTFAPNFFLASLSRALASPNGIELRKKGVMPLRTLVSGGEANVLDTCVGLGKILRDAGAPENCIKPGFGMTETSAGCTYSHVCPEYDIAQGHSFASVGEPIDGFEIRIVDDDGHVIPANNIGLVQVRGEVVFDRYFNDPVATQQSFDNGWFNTGDQGFVSNGQLTLTGRAKETLIVNGVNYSPSSVEAALENIDGTVPSYTLVFPYRMQGADTETLCVIYLPTFQDAQSREKVNNAISTAVLLQIGVRPHIIPVDATVLQKSTLGKLPRSKIRKTLEAGLLEPFDRHNQKEIAIYREACYEPPASAIEQLIVDTFIEVLNVRGLRLGVTTNLLAVGIDSIALIAIKQRLQLKLHSRLEGSNIPITTIISNPTPRELALVLEPAFAPQHLKMLEKHEYDPVVILHSSGDRCPLWLIHPGVGEVLVFIALSYHINDRPVYALRARGFEVGEEPFESIEEAVQIYHARIRQVQPNGPYVMAGYSFGAMLTFEVAKLLRTTDEVRFLGILNLPPHIKTRMRQLDWYNCLLHLAHFLNLLSEEEVKTNLPILRKGSHNKALELVLGIAPPKRLAQLELDEASLGKWVNIAHSMQSSAINYEPSGMVDCMDVFYAIPLTEVAKDMDDWVINHLSKWVRFCAEQPRFHRVDGTHYTMISPAHVFTFQKVLKEVFKERNV